MEDFCTVFQQTVSKNLVRHRSILDAMTKYQESGARVNRAVAKAATACGCIEIGALKQPMPESMLLSDFKDSASSHIRGELCEHCHEIIEEELGNNLFYLTALCELLGLKLQDIVQKENNRVSTLGYFKLG